MRYFNTTKGYYMPIVGDEPNIIDDNATETRKITIECVRFFINSQIVKNVGDSFQIRHKNSNDGNIDNWYTAKSDKTVLGFTTFSSIAPVRTAAIAITPAIISGSWEYDGEKERFKIPLLSPIYSIDNITCSLSDKTSNRNILTIEPIAGTIEIERDV